MEAAEHKKDAEPNAVSVIGPGLIIRGNIESSVDPQSIDLHIEGQVEGDVRCATLILGEGSLIKGSVYADRVRVSGTVEGGIDAKDLAIEASARVSGDILYDRLRVANGGVIQGTMRWKGDAEVAESGKLKLVTPSAADRDSQAVYID